ncbi:MAG: DUF2292 domain-containing protein [Planctomycetes bacterium]|jgi:hypothetical protein|nr:DUF2292 domain-containing protein [Planctomycetota bacterium]
MSDRREPRDAPTNTALQELLEAIETMRYGAITVKVQGGVPLNNLEGVGGIAFNPLAYLGGNGAPEKEDTSSKAKTPLWGLPQIGGWYVHLGDVAIDWTTFGIAETLFDRVEVSYCHEIVGPSEARTRYKDNTGVKSLVVKEGKVVPAVSVGGVWKRTTFEVPGGVDDTGIDLCLVATKLTKEGPRPVLLSGGLVCEREPDVGGCVRQCR